tara:strand:- start:38 stop:235 length:198 start_codon:yes stop_codon:yes gene_type:complete
MKKFTFELGIWLKKDWYWIGLNSIIRTFLEASSTKLFFDNKSFVDVSEIPFNFLNRFLEIPNFIE